MSSGLWITPPELDSTLSSEPDAGEACSMASFVLWALSGRKYNRTRTVTETYECACSRPSDWLMPMNGRIAYPVLTGGEISNVSAGSDCGCQGTVGGRHVRLRLRGKPVRRVLKVSRAGQELDPSTYRVENSGLLTLDSAAPGDVCGLEVTYTYGTGIPGGGRVAAKLLAQELLRGWVGDEQCRLPDRVTSVTREGMSFTILDKQDFLDELRTGIYEVDLFLRATNPDKARKPAKVFSPDLPKAYRVTANGVPPSTLDRTVRPYDLYGTQGEELYRGLRKYDTDGEPIDLTGYSFKAEARITGSSTSTLIIDLSSYLDISGTDVRLLELVVPADVTETLTDVPTTARWDVFIWPTGNISASTKWLEGSFAIAPSVTIV